MRARMAALFPVRITPPDARTEEKTSGKWPSPPSDQHDSSVPGFTNQRALLVASLTQLPNRGCLEMVVVSLQKFR